MTDAAVLEERLRRFFRAHGTVLVALSGGVDSSVLAVLAADELHDNALAVTAISPSLAHDELAAIRRFCARFHIQHEETVSHEMSRPDYVRNLPDRCYHCKSELFTRLLAIAEQRGIECVVDGTHVDDLDGHRPGRQAADERSVLSPLVSAGAGKEAVRALARQLGLPNADRPSSPCLASRVAYGVPLTIPRLAKVHHGERVLKELGFQDCRVRLHEAGDATIARIEVPRAQLLLAAEEGPRITQALRPLGFTWVTLDLLGQRSGSLLEAFPGRPS